MEELTPREYQALSLVNEKIVMDGPTLAHIMYKNQTALPRCFELLNNLTVAGYVHMFQMFPPKFACTEKGEEYLAAQPKPLKPFSL